MNNEETLILKMMAYLFYLGISLPLSYFVSKALLLNGRIFLLEGFQGSSEMADSVNKLQQLGFILITFGLIFLCVDLGMDQVAFNFLETIKVLSLKIGGVLICLGIGNYLSMKNIARIRSKGTKKEK